MVCIQCSQELNDDAKFCTKCGTKCNSNMINKDNKLITYLSLIISIIGIIGYWIISNRMEWSINIAQSIRESLDPSYKGLYLLSGLKAGFYGLIYSGILLALISLYKGKNKFSLIAGLVPCIYILFIQLPKIFPTLKILRIINYFGY